jgi:hypothetical protein
MGEKHNYAKEGGFFMGFTKLFVPLVPVTPKILESKFFIKKLLSEHKK